ncbi:hypothetical protein MIND_01303000 [Mycena indigotica]|uniref:Uncharacterized protein n=1 Tax=Mycena indigotica TaxID=2126181 RepID=A0A8H6VUK1_9AGAR|nr:uncharacterized protein MIND_01303000 [Mycena indigotica]KAF7290628.1 hypothetical protein MIND_01303000 [Mycena indigotica]
MSFDSSRSFLMSQRAADQRRNMHVFSFHFFPQVRLAGGLNLNRIHLTAKTFYRWLCLCHTLVTGEDLEAAVVLRKIQLATVDVSFYSLAAIQGPPIPRDSLQLIQPGIYGIFSQDGTPFTSYVSSAVSFRTSFKAQEDEMVRSTKSPEFRAHNQIPMHLRTLAGARDRGKCFITGQTHLPTQCVWIIPPLATFNGGLFDPMDLDKSKVVDNLITICSVLVDPFMHNLFSVDLEDNARIIVFDDLPSGVPTLPLRLPTLPSPASTDFWKSSFIVTLGNFFPAGELDEDGSRRTRSGNAGLLMEELHDDCADLDDPKWQSDVGTEVVQVYMNLNLPSRRELLEEQAGDYGSEDEFVLSDDE